MQVVQKLYIELQEMCPDMKIKTAHFWFQGTEYEIYDGIIYKKGECVGQISQNNNEI